VSVGPRSRYDEAMRRFLSLFIALAVISAGAAAQDKPKIDITGTWTFTVQSPAGTGTPTVVFKQGGDTLTGTYRSQALGTHDFKGTLKDGKISFAFNAESGGTAFTMQFTGTVADKDNMKGDIDFSGMAQGSFSGKRAPPPSP
jgi:hypothetical protein